MPVPTRFQPEVMPEAHGAPPGSMSLGGVFLALWRRKLWIAGPVIAAGAAAAMWLSTVEPLYRSTAKLLIESQETVYTRPGVSPLERELLDREAVRSQEQLLLSGDLARHIVRDLDLGSHPAFASDGSTSLMSRALAFGGITRDSGRLSAEEKVLDWYYDNLDVQQIEESRVIAVEFSAEDPDLAARVANAVSQGYIDMQRVAKRDVTVDASQWLGDQVTLLRERVAEAEGRVEEFRRDSGLFVGRGDASQPRTLTEQQLAELSSQLAGVRVEKSDMQARARLIRSMLDSGAALDSMDVLDSELIRNLDQEEVRLQAQLSQLSSSLGPRHPQIKALTAEIGDLRGQIRAEVERIVRALENEAEVAAEREAQLIAGIEALKSGAADANEQEVQLRALEREASSLRDMLETMLARYADASARDTLAALPADARLISRAMPASKPYFPQTPAILIAVMLAAGILSAGTVVTHDLLAAVNPHGGAGLPAYVPSAPIQLVSRVAGPAGEPAAGSAGSAADSDLDAVVRTMLGRAGGEHALMTLLTSVRRTRRLPEMALDLARQLSSAGRRVVIVDAAFGEGFATAMGAADRSGLSELLTGTTAFEKAILRDPASRVHVIPAGESPSDPLLLVGSDRMDTVLDALGQTYDVVILLTAAVSRQAEARVLAKRADFAVLVTRKSVSDASTDRARSRLEAAGVSEVALLTIDEGGGIGLEPTPGSDHHAHRHPMSAIAAPAG